MTDLRAALIAAHRGNVARYLQVLRTHLTPLERDFVTRRLSEERAALRALQAEAVREQIGDVENRMPPPNLTRSTGRLAAP
jgi:hypothetical protein